MISKSCLTDVGVITAGTYIDACVKPVYMFLKEQKGKSADHRCDLIMLCGVFNRNNVERAPDLCYFQ